MRLLLALLVLAGAVTPLQAKWKISTDNNLGKQAETYVNGSLLSRRSKREAKGVRFQFV